MTNERGPKRRPIPEDEIELLVAAPAGHEVGPAIQEFLERSGFSRIVQFGAVAEVWSEVVGEDVQRHCKPVRLDGNDLVVEVDHRGWITELSFRQRAILDSLAERLGRPVVSHLKVTLAKRSDVE